MSALVALFILLIPFSYLTALNVRIVLFQMVIGFVILILKLMGSGRIRINSIAVVLFIFCLLILSYSLVTRNFSVFFASAVFSFSYLVLAQIPGLMSERVLLFYRVGVIFSAVGVLIQVVIFLFLGIDLFNVQQFGGNRNAFGFIWEDYSFLSLYLASAIPLFFRQKFDYRFLCISSFLLLASVATSARTGAAGFLIFISAAFIFYLARVFISGKINKGLMLLFASVLMVPFFMISGLERLTGRVLTLSSSGRIQDFVYGYDYFLRSPIFGAFFDDDFYSSSISIVPHNLFIYSAYLGGILATALLMVLLFFVALKMRSMDRRVACSLLICFAGLQFIPSFFSAYFVSALLGIGALRPKGRLK